jgi:hypothetical protein
MKTTVFAMFTTILLFYGCNGTAKKNNLTSSVEKDSLIEITFDYETNCLPFDSLFDDTFCVRLEATDKSLIGRIHQILFTEDKIIVIDKSIAKNISVFDMSGKFQNNISNFGGGPQDYIGIYHATLTPDNKNIVINNNVRQLKFFEINGKFVKNIDLKFRIDNFEFINDKIIISDYASGNQIGQNDKSYKPRMIISDYNDGKILYSGFQSYYNTDFTSTTLFPVKKFNNSIYYNPSYSDTVYKISENGYYPYYKLTMKGVKQMIPNESTTNKILYDYHDRYPFFNGDFFDLENAVFVRFWEPDSEWRKFALYSKKQQKSFCCNGYLSNPLFFHWYTPIAIYKNSYLVSVIDAAEVLSLKDNFYSMEKFLPQGRERLLDDLFENLTEDDNPVLFFYRVNI